MRGAIESLRRLVVGQDVRLARESQRRAVVRAASDRRAFERHLAGDPGPSRITLGRYETLAGRSRWVGLPREEFLSRFWWWTGATGSGKSMSALGVLIQLLAGGDLPIVVVDAKGEMSGWLRERVFPSLAARSDAEAFLKHLRIIRPFDSQFTPMLRITAPEPAVPPAAQAIGLATSLAEAVGGDLGHRMQRVFTVLTAVAIARGDALPILVDWLRSPAAFARAARATDRGDLVDYAVREFPSENKESIRALQSRLGELLFVPEVRACFEASGCVDFGECLERGVTLVDACDPPGGVERVKQLMESLILGRLARAVLHRPVVAGSPTALLAFEEFQESLRTREAENFGRLVALARSRKTCLCFINQQPQQLDPTLRRLLRTNTGGELAFRCSREDAEGIAHALPLDAAARSAAARRQAVIHSLTSLPRRSCLLWLKDRPFGAHLIRSPRLDLDALHPDEGDLSPEVWARLHRGSIAVPRQSVIAGVEPEPNRPPRAEVASDEPGEFPGLG